MSSFAVSNFNIQVNAQANPEADWEMFIGLSLDASDGTTPATGAAFLTFYPDASTLPNNTSTVQNNNVRVYGASFHTSQFANVLAVIRGAKALNFFFDEKSLSAIVTPVKKPSATEA
jgi:hypothetical protein